MEETVSSSDSQKLFKIKRDTGGRQTSVSEVRCDKQ